MGGMSEHEPVPTWVKVSVVAVAVVALVVALVLLLAGGEHGPGRHTSAAPSAAASVDLSQ